MDMDAVQDEIPGDTENIKHISDTQVQMQNIDEDQVNIESIEETQVVNNNNIDETLLTVEINNVENSFDDTEPNNLVKSEDVEPFVAEEDTYNGGSKSISEVGIETKVKVDPENSKDFDEEVHDTESFEEVEETYDEEIEEDGEVKVITKTRFIKVKKQAHEEEKREEEVEEEYEEEELGENGEVKVVKKIRIVKVVQPSASKTQSVVSYVEEAEEYEEEEVDETGESKIVIKTRMVRIPKEKVHIETTGSFEEVEEEFEEEEVDDNGEMITVTKKRVVKVPKKSIKSEEKLDVLGEDEGESNRSIVERKSVEHEFSDEDESEGSKESVDEDDLEEELAEEEKKAVKKKKYKLDKADVIGSEEEDKGKRKIKKKKRERRKSLIEVEQSKSQLSADSVKEGEDVVKEDTEERSEESGDQSSKVTMSSEEQRIAAEKAEIAQQFDILLKLRGDHIYLRRKSFSLNNRLVQYFKKQKMEYVFTETKEDQDLDSKFYKKLGRFFEYNKEVMEEKININTEWETQKQVNEELSNSVKEARERLFEKKREIGSKMIDSRTGRTIHHDKAIEDIVGRQELLMRHLSECCLSQIKLKRRIEAKRRERQMEHMGTNFNLMDYEKLASLKEYYMDKITERDVEINEVSEKLAAMEENMNLVRDRLKRTEDELETEQLRLQDVSTDLLRKRANLNQVKATRHRTEKNTAKIKQQSGLLAYPILLKDYEDKSQQLKELSSQLESLKQNHRNGIIKIRNLRDNIRKRTAMKYSSGISGKLSTMSTSFRET